MMMIVIIVIIIKAQDFHWSFCSSPKFQQMADKVHIWRASSVRREGLWAVEPDGVWTSPPVLVLSPAGTQTHTNSASQSLSSAHTPASAKFTLLQRALSQPGYWLWVTMPRLLLLLLFLPVFIFNFRLRIRLRLVLQPNVPAIHH